MSRPVNPILPNVRDLSRVPSDLVSVPQAALMARVSPRTIWKLIRTGRIPAWGPPKCYRVSISQLLPRVEPGSGFPAA